MSRQIRCETEYLEVPIRGLLVLVSALNRERLGREQAMSSLLFLSLCLLLLPSFLLLLPSSSLLLSMLIMKDAPSVTVTLSPSSSSPLSHGTALVTSVSSLLTPRCQYLEASNTRGGDCSGSTWVQEIVRSRRLIRFKSIRSVTCSCR